MAYLGLKKQVDQLDPSNQQKFADGLQDVADGLKKIEKMDQDALAKLQSGELGTAMAKQPGCQKATPSPAATGSASPKAGSTPSGKASAKPSGSASKTTE